MSSLEEKYKKEELQNHIYNTPDTYVGGCDLIIENLPLYNSESKRIEFRDTEFIPALYNTFNEILVNAKDQVTRLNELYKHDKRVNIISLSRSFGYQNALQAGLKNVKAKFYSIIDVDCEDPPELLEEFY